MDNSPPKTVQATFDEAPWVALVAKRYGLQFGPTRVRRLRAALVKRLDATGLSEPAYRSELESNRNAEEWQELVNELVIGETRFFRHLPSFQLLQQTLLPSRLKQTNPTSGIRILSAGCANGTETYSLAMCSKPLTDSARRQLTVTGVDVCSEAISKAKRGNYLQRELRGLAPTMRALHLTSQDDGSSFDVSAELKETTHFQLINLHENKSLGADFDIIFCQNLFIYLAQPDRQRLIGLFADHLLPAGYLILGPAEVYKSQDSRLRKLEHEQTLVFQKTPVGTEHS